MTRNHRRKAFERMMIGSMADRGSSPGDAIVGRKARSRGDRTSCRSSLEILWELLIASTEEWRERVGHRHHPGWRRVPRWIAILCVVIDEEWEWVGP